MKKIWIWMIYLVAMIATKNDLDINEEDEDEDLFGSSNDDDETKMMKTRPHGTGAASPAESQEEAFV